MRADWPPQSDSQGGQSSKQMLKSLLHFQYLLQSENIKTHFVLIWNMCDYISTHLWHVQHRLVVSILDQHSWNNWEHWFHQMEDRVFLVPPGPTTKILASSKTFSAIKSRILSEIFRKKMMVTSKYYKFLFSMFLILVPFTLFFFQSTSSSGRVTLYLFLLLQMMKHKTRLKMLMKNTITDNPKVKTTSFKL